VIDAHCHLDLYQSPARVVAACARLDLDVLSVTTAPSAWAGTKRLAEGAARLVTALGLHPQLAKERRREVVLFERLVERTLFVGEVGLDGSAGFRSSWTDQTAVFGRVLSACAGNGGRILSIHSRGAVGAVLEMIAAEPHAGIPILHWFSGSAADLARAVAIGCWFSVGPAMLNTERGRRLARVMPPDRVLTESDGPFAIVDGQPALPSDVHHAVATLATLWGTTRLSAESLVQDNWLRLRRGPPGSARRPDDSPQQPSDSR
jgi:TatD DNase family protein